MKTYTITKPFLNTKCSLGESPFWNPETNELRFLDIQKNQVWHVDLNVFREDRGHEDGEGEMKDRNGVRVQKFEASMGHTANHAEVKDGYIFSGKYGIGIARNNSAEVKYLTRWWTTVEEKGEQNKSELFRANDGAVDSRGRLWASVMNDPVTTAVGRDSGILYRYDQDGRVHQVLSGVGVPNGLSWSLDDRIMYFTDSMKNTIFAYDFDGESGEIDVSSQSVFFKPGDGLPDGHAQDVDGNLWVALWTGSKVVCVSPKGEVLVEISVPTPRPTAVAFAGEDLYITSAEVPGKKDSAVENYQGALFKCHVGIRGRPISQARIPL